MKIKFSAIKNPINIKLQRKNINILFLYGYYRVYTKLTAKERRHHGEN